VRKRDIFKVSLICFFLCFSIAYGIESGLEIDIDKEEITIHEAFNIEITAKDIDGIAGGDILLYYDDTKLHLISKKVELEDEDIVDYQKIITEVGDRPGEVRLVFALKKDKPLLEGDNRLLGTLTFETIGIGNGEISLASTSRFVKESFTEAGIHYSYVNPWIASPMQIHIKALPQEIPSEDPDEQPNEDPNEEPEEEPVDLPDNGGDEEPDDTPQEIPANEPTDNPSDDSDNDPDDSPPIGSVEEDEGFQDNLVNDGDKIQLESLDIHSVNQEGLTLRSRVYWLDNSLLTQGFTIPFEGEDIDRLGIYYYHELKEKWIYLGGEVHGNTLTVGPIRNNINFNRLAVLEDRKYPAFIDVTKEDLNPDLLKILTLGIMRGYEDVTLRLDQVMTREEWTTAWICTLDLPLIEEDKGLAVTNVSPWARTYVQMAIEVLEDEYFIGNENLTMEEGVKILERAMEKTHGSVDFILPKVEADALLTRRQAVELLAQVLRYLNI
jgi:hypothetical protein